MNHLYRAALAASLIGFVASLVVHIRSLFGFGFYHWYAPFGLIFILFVPYILACDGIVYGGATGWRKNPLEYLGPSTTRASWLGVDFFEHQKRWSQAFARRPGWLKKLDSIFFGYFFIMFIIPFLIKIHTENLSNVFSLTTLPPSIVRVISSGWMMCYWGFFSTFWLVNQINLEP
jgi:hypothetical protein